MPVNVKSNDTRRLANHTELLDPAKSSGSFQINIPFPADNIAIINQTNATLAVDIGQVGDPTGEALPFLPMAILALPIRETQKITVFWSGSIAAEANKIILLFSDEAIQIQGGTLSPTGVNVVNVANVPDVNISVMPEITLAANQQIKLNAGVDIDTLPPLVAGAAAIGTVGVTSLPGIEGPAAHDAPISGKPLRGAGRAANAN